MPPWVPDLPASPEDETGNQPSGDNQSHQETVVSTAQDDPPQVAPHARFGPARRSLGRFARDGEFTNLRSALGHYVRRGYGGASTATQRMGGTVSAAGALYAALSSATEGRRGEESSQFDFLDFSDKSTDEMLDVLVEVVRPIDGTLDAEATRAALRDALSDLLNRFPDADLTALSDEQRIFTVERYVALDVYNFFRLDMGKTLQDKAPSLREGLSRLKEVKDYITETISANFRAIKNLGEQLTRSGIANLAHQALQQSFEVFEGYVT